MTRRLQTLEALRGMAALLVLIYHVRDVVLTRTGVAPLGDVLVAGHRGTDFFFVLSGFIIALTHLGHDARPDRPAVFLLRRSLRLLPSLWIMSLVAILAYATGFGGMEKAAKLESWHIAASLLLLPQADSPLINVSWTLVYEMFFYVLFAAFLNHRRVGILLLGAWQGAILAVLISGIDRALLPGGFYLHPRCLGFGVGVLCAMLVAYRDGAVLRRAAPAILVAGACLFLGDITWERRTGVDRWGPLFLVSLYLGAGMIIAGATLLERAGRGRTPRILLALGTVSYSIYLVHFGVITLSVVVLLRFGFPVGLPMAVLCGVLGLAAGVTFHYFVDAPLQQRLRRVFARPRGVRDHPFGARMTEASSPNTKSV